MNENVEFELIDKKYLKSLLDRIKELESFLKTRDILAFERRKNNIKRKNVFHEFYNKYLETGLSWYNLDENDIEGEIWKPIKDVENGYFISNFGRVKSSISKFSHSFWMLKQQKNRYGYLRVGFLKGKNGAAFVHRLVAINFLENPENKPEVNHINGNKEDNRVLNLEWHTKKENIQHAFKTGLKVNKSGENHNYAKFNNSQIKEIKLMLKNGVPQRKIAKLFGTKQAHISNIKRNIIWKHIQI